MRGLALAVLITGLAAPAALARPRRGSDSYILAVGQSWSSSDVDMDELAAMRDRLSGDFLWFRRAGKAYRVEDPAALKKARECFAPLRALEPELDAFRGREEALDAKEEALDREQDAIEGDREDLDYDEEAGLAVTPDERESLETRQDSVAAKLRELSPERRQLETAERDLDAREEDLEREAEANLWRLADEMVVSGLAKPWPPAR